MPVIAREKTNAISSWGREHESVCISLIARVCNNGSRVVHNLLVQKKVFRTEKYFP